MLSTRASKEAALPESSEPINPSSLHIRRTPVASPPKLIGKADCLSFDNVDVLLCEVSFFNLSRLIRGNPPDSSGRSALPNKVRSSTHMFSSTRCLASNRRRESATNRRSQRVDDVCTNLLTSFLIWQVPNDESPHWTVEAACLAARRWSRCVGLKGNIDYRGLLFMMRFSYGRRIRTSDYPAGNPAVAAGGRHIWRKVYPGPLILSNG
jgi:hypothetical protein